MAEPERCAVLHGVESDVLTESLTQHPFTAVDRPVLATARTGVIGMGMGDQSPWHRTPWINPGIGGPAIQPLSRSFNQRLISSMR